VKVYTTICSKLVIIPSAVKIHLTTTMIFVGFYRLLIALLKLHFLQNVSPLLQASFKFNQTSPFSSRENVTQVLQLRKNHLRCTLTEILDFTTGNSYCIANRAQKHL